MSRGWVVPLVIATPLAARTIFASVASVLDGLPRAYGEGAVAHAGQILARGGDPYAPASGFVSANYPPLGYAFAALAEGVGPFTGLRVADLLAALGVAIALALTARADRIVAITLAASFLALYPVASWLPQARVDLPAVALTFGAVVAIRARHASLFAAFAILAVAAKPTAAVPLGVVLAYAVWRERDRALPALAALTAAALMLAGVLLARFDAAGLYTHLVTYNAFPYDGQNVLPFAILGALLLGVFVALASFHGDGYARAYVVGALGVVLLVGHQGATMNYLLDLAAASCLALALAVRSLGRWTSPLIAGQLAGTLALSVVGPFALLDIGGHPERVALLASMARGTYYAEDSGVLIANGIEPLVDDAYVWSRLVALGERVDEVTPLAEHRALQAVVTEVPLDTLAAGPQYRIERWPSSLVDAVLRNYELGPSIPGVYVYLPRH